MRDQMQKAEDFRALHQRDGAFIIPNPWDIGACAPGLVRSMTQERRMEE